MADDGQILALLAIAGLAATSVVRGRARLSSFDSLLSAPARTEGSRGVVRRRRSAVQASPTEGKFVPWRVEPSYTLVGPVRNVRGRTRVVRLTEQEINRAIAGAMTQYRETRGLRNPGTFAVTARSNPRSKHPREAAVVLVREDTVSEPKFRGYHAVVFRAVVDDDEPFYEAIRLAPGLNWLVPFRDEALNDEGAKEAARRWLIEVFEEAWAKGRADTPHLLRPRGSRGVVRSGRSSVTPERAVEVLLKRPVHDLTRRQQERWSDGWMVCPHGTEKWVLAHFQLVAWRDPGEDRAEGRTLYVQGNQEGHDYVGPHFGECWCDLKAQPSDLQYYAFWLPEDLEVDFI